MYVNWPVCGSSLSVIPNPSRPAPGLPAPGLSGLGCATCSGNGAIQYGSFPMGRGLGYFATGMDLSGWGAAEWLTVIGGVYVLFSIFSTARRGYGRVRGGLRRRRQRSSRRADLLARRATIDRQLREV